MGILHPKSQATYSGKGFVYGKKKEKTGSRVNTGAAAGSGLPKGNQAHGGGGKDAPAGGPGSYV